MVNPITYPRRLRDPESAIPYIFEQLMRDVFTMLPGEVREYDPTTGLATVKPLVKFRKLNGEEISRPDMLEVPVLSIFGSGWGFEIAPRTGDIITLLYSMRSLDEFLETDYAESSPEPFRMHDQNDLVVGLAFRPISWPVAIEGVRISKEGEPPYVILMENEVQVRWSDAIGVRIDANGITIDGNVQINGTVNTSSTITARSDISTPADVIAGSISLKTHLHGGITPGPGDTGVPK